MNYNEIKDLALSYADRKDSGTISRMDDFLRVTESRINKALKTQKMSVRAVLQTVDKQEYYSLPPDYSGLRDIELRSTLHSRDRCTLQYMSPEQLNNRSASPGDQVYYTLIANQIQIMPPRPTGEILEIIYFRKVPPLTPSESENWVSVSDPDLYLFGLLVEISSFLKDANASAMWDARFAQCLEAIQSDDLDNRWSGTALQIRVG